MEQLNDSGESTCINLRQISNSLTVLPDTILKDGAILSYEGPAAIECDLKQSLPGLQTHDQYNTECCLRKSTVLLDGQTGQSTAVLSRQNYNQHEPKHFCSKDRPPETSATGEKLLHQKCPAQLNSTSFEPQSASCASTTKNTSQQSIPHMIVQNTNNLSGSQRSNIHNQQQHVKISNNFSKDSICQGLFTDVGHFGVILAQGQTVFVNKLCQRNEQNNYQQKYVLQKAIAVVTPLTQQVVVDVTSTKNLTKVKEGGDETRSISNKNVHQPYILHTLHPTTIKSDAKTNRVPSKSVLATGNSHCVMDNRPVENIKFDSVRKEGKEAVQPYDNNCSATFLGGDDVTVMGLNSEGTETKRDPGVDHFSTIPVNKWSLERLQTLVNDLEQTQKKQQKDILFNDVFSEILKLYWNGDCNKLCSAAKSNLYVSIIKEVRLHYGKENSVILHELPKERQNEFASRFHILEHGIAPPRSVYTSTWLNLSENFYDIDKEGDCLSSLITTNLKSKIADKEVPMKGMENKQEPTDEKVKASDQALSGILDRYEEKQSKPLPPEHQKNSIVKGEKTIRKEPVLMDVKNTCLVKETEKQDSMAVKNEKQKTKGENEALVDASKSAQPSDVSNSYEKKLPTTDMTPVLDKNGSSDCISVKMNTIPPEKARRPCSGEPGEEAIDDVQKGDAGILPDSRDQVTVELFDQDKPHMDTATKSNERSIRIEINRQLETYCCLSKWFYFLGYTNIGLCKCEKKAELSHHTDSSGEGVHEANADNPQYPLNKACKLTNADICGLRDNRQAKNRLGYKSMTGKKSVTSSTDDRTDEIKIVDVVTNYEDVLKIANAMSDQLTEMPLVRRTSLYNTGRKHDPSHKKITSPELKTKDTLINLTLFGTSHLRQKKSISGFMSSDKVHLPPEIINVRIRSDCNEFPNYSKSQISNQQVWNSWRKIHVPLMMSTKRRQKHQLAETPESENSVMKTTAFDLRSHKEDLQTQQSEATSKKAFSLTSSDKRKTTDTNHSKKKSRKKRSSRMEKFRKLKLKKILASFHPIKKWNYANNRSKPMKSSFDLTQATNTSKNKLNTNSAINFGVLPESFVISDSNPSMEANQSANADSGSEVKSVIRIKRTWGMSGVWCESPRKKQCLKSTSTVPNRSGSSTFQEFKKKYEEKKRRIPT